MNVIKSIIKNMGQKEDIRKFLEDRGLVASCFSNTFKNTLMWSHYADEHKGIVIGFNRNAIEKHTKKIFIANVDYPKNNKRPKFHFAMTLKGNNWIDPIRLTKSNEWNYEEEVRLFLYEPNREEKVSFFYDYKEELINRIYFGCRIDKTIKKEIIKYIKRNKLNIQIFNMRLSKTLYKLEATRL